MSKVVIVTNIPAPYRVDLFYYMQTHIKEHEFYVIYTNRTEDNRQWKIDEKKLINSIILKSKVVKMKRRRSRLDCRYIHIPPRLSPVLKEINPDIVIAFEYNPAAFQSLIWCKRKRRRFIHLTDGTLLSEKDISLTQKLMRKIITAGADACIASSTKAAEKLYFWGVPKQKVFISLLTVDLSAYRSLEKKEVSGRILYVGRPTSAKGIDLLISALSYIDIDYVLHIVGSAEKEEIMALKKTADKKGISDRIVWRGYKEGADLLQEYSEASVFVLPTRMDCFGLVLLEAMCAKVPAIASKYADGAYDIISEGENGFIVDPYDEKAFASVMERLLTDKELRENFSHGNEEIREKFEFRNVIEGYSKAIDYVVKQDF